jgi:hypothetical protein
MRTVEVSKSEQFVDYHGDQSLPEFVWLDIVGTCARDDFGFHKNGRLVVSQAALDVLKSGRLDHCEVEAFRDSCE